MSIRYKLTLLFGLTVLAFLFIHLYTATFYQDLITEERELTEQVNRTIELAHVAEMDFQNQLNAWKNVLLRGNETGRYHEHLQEFFNAERRVREHIDSLAQRVLIVPQAEEVVAELSNAYFEIGRKFRQAIRVFNATDSNAGPVTDRYISGIEELPKQYLEQIIAILKNDREQHISDLSRLRLQQQQQLTAVVFVSILMLVLIFLWLMQKNIVRPAEHAAFLAEVIDNAQRVAQFGTWDWNQQEDRHYWSDGLFPILGLATHVKPSYQQFLSCLHEDDRVTIEEALHDARKELDEFDLHRLRYIRTQGTGKPPGLSGQF